MLRLLPLFSAGLAGLLGSGRQWLSWTGLDDLIDVYHRAFYDDRLAGPGAAPARTAARPVLRSPAVVG